MKKNKKVLLIIATSILIAVMAIFTFSPITFSDIKYIFIKRPIEATLSVNPTILNAVKNPPTQIKIANIEKTNVDIDVTNTTKENLNDVKVSLVVLAKENDYSNVYLGSTTTPKSKISRFRYGKNNVIIDLLTPLKAGEKRNIKAYIFSTAPGTYKVQAGVLTKQYAAKTNIDQLTFK